MTKDEAISIAEEHVLKKGCSGLHGEILAYQKKRMFSGKLYWRIVSNFPKKGGNWFIEIEDDNGAIKNVNFNKK